jgi:ABC-type antimicrobial peptide transport system permease subunit
VNFFVNFLAVACLGPGMLWALIYILDAMSVTMPSERNIAFYMYLVIAALLALYSLLRILQVQTHAKKSRDDGSRSV